MIQHLFSSKLIRYGLIGGTATLLHISVASLYLYSVDDSILFSNIVGFLSAYLFSYILQSTLVFEHAPSFVKALKYFVVQLGGLLLAIWLSRIFDGYNNYLKTFIIAFLLPLLSFVIHKLWTFREIH